MLEEGQTEGGSGVLRWIEALQRGEDAEANSRRVFRQYYAWVHRFFARRGADDARAEELAQEVFFQAFQRIGSFRGDGSFESWLFAIAANLWRNENRHRKRQKRDRPEVSIDVEADDEAAPIQVVDGAESPAEETFNKERLAALDQAIRQLPEKQQDCIRLRLAGHDYPDIAELLRLSPSTARVHVFSARKRLTKTFGDAFGQWVD